MMRYKLQTQLGDSKIQFEGEVKDLGEFIEKSAVLYTLPKVCGNCGKSDRLVPDHRSGVSAETNKPYDYHEVNCGHCRWRFSWGKRQDGSGLFPKKWEAPYVGGSNGQQTQAQDRRPEQQLPPEQQHSSGVTEDNIPF